MITVEIATQALQQPRAGLPCYDGNPYDFEQAYKDIMRQDHIEPSVKVIEWLKNDALNAPWSWAVMWLLRQAEF